MTTERIEKFIAHCKKAQELGISYSQYEKDGYTFSNYFGTFVYSLKKEPISELVTEALDVYNAGKHNNGGKKTVTTAVKVESEGKSKVEYIRDEDGKIVAYKYEIYCKDKAPLHGSLSRDEMNLIYRLYSYYGDGLQQRIIARQFPELSQLDLKRVLRAFQITKASSPFAPHMYEEFSEEELLDMQIREKENSFLRKADEEDIKNNKKLLYKISQEKIELEKRLKEYTEFKIDVPENIVPTYIQHGQSSNNDLILYLSDMHLGAAVNAGTLYDENINYGVDELKRRLTEVLTRVKSLGYFDNIIINLMGDNIDCCGVDGKTARLDHHMPENMCAREQGNKYVELMLWFIESIISNNMCNNVQVYSVPSGNHDGNYGYAITQWLLAMINAKFPEVQTKMFEDFYGVIEMHGHKFIICHGKDAQFMKKGLPLNLDDKTARSIYEWLDYRKIYGDNIHVVKGDLHSNNLNSCRKLDYRNVLSLFGASDYSSFNFSRNSYGVSYDLFIGDNLVRGTFENM